jgi:hypothetical protein
MDEYYVIRIPYGSEDNQAQIAGIGEFWRTNTSFQIPVHYLHTGGGFPDRQYNWSVQVKRCIANCDKVLDDNVTKQGIELGPQSEKWVLYWYPDIGGGTPIPTPPLHK